MLLSLLAALPSNSVMIDFLEEVIIIVLIAGAIIFVLTRMGAPAIAIQITYFIFGLIALFFLFGLLRSVLG